MSSITTEQAKEISEKKERERKFQELRYTYDSLTRQLKDLNAYFLLTIEILTKIDEAEDYISSSIHFMSEVEITESEFKIGPKYNNLVKSCTNTIASNNHSFDGTKSQIRQTQKNLIYDMNSLRPELENTYKEMQYWNRTGEFVMPEKVDFDTIIEHYNNAMGAK